MKLSLTEEISRIKYLIEQKDITPEKAACGPQSCGITKAQGKEEKTYARQNREADKESLIQQKIDAKDAARDTKLSLDIDFDYLNDKRDKDDRNNVRRLYSSFDKNLLQGGKYNTDQKFAALYKVLENLRRRPQLSYAVRLKEKFPNIDPKSTTLEQLANIANQLSWDKFVDWFLAGGPKITS